MGSPSRPSLSAIFDSNSPYHIVSKILCNLDSYSIRSLLVAHPRLRNRTVRYLIALGDEKFSQKTPTFFGRAGVRTLSVHESDISIVEETHARFEVTLFEIRQNVHRYQNNIGSFLGTYAHFFKSGISFVVGNQIIEHTEKLRVGKHIPAWVDRSLSRLNYLYLGHGNHIYGPHHDMLHGNSGNDMCGELEGPDITSLRTLEMASSCYPHQSFTLIEGFGGCISHLEITCAVVVSGLRLPNLLSLDIHCLRDENNTIPMIFDIEAVKLTRFFIRYNGVMPLISDIKLQNSPYDYKKMVFELRNLSASDITYRPCVDYWTDIKRDYGKMDLSFTQLFRFVVVVGVHPTIVASMNLENVKTLIYYLTVQFTLSSEMDSSFTRPERRYFQHFKNEFSWLSGQTKSSCFDDALQMQNIQCHTSVDACTKDLEFFIFKSNLPHVVVPAISFRSRNSIRDLEDSSNGTRLPKFVVVTNGAESVELHHSAAGFLRPGMETKCESTFDCSNTSQPTRLLWSCPFGHGHQTRRAYACDVQSNTSECDLDKDNTYFLRGDRGYESNCGPGRNAYFSSASFDARFHGSPKLHAFEDCRYSKIGCHLCCEARFDVSEQERSGPSWMLFRDTPII